MRVGGSKHSKEQLARISKCDIRFFASGISSNGVLNSGLPDVEIPRIALHEYVLENIDKWENHTAMVIHIYFLTLIIIRRMLQCEFREIVLLVQYFLASI